MSIRLYKKIISIILLVVLNLNIVTTVIAAPLIMESSFDVTAGGFNGEVIKTLLDDDNKILVVGNFTEYNSTSVNRIVRLNPEDGTIDNTFDIGTGVNGKVNAITFDNDGKIIIAGDFTEYNGTSMNRIVRLNNDGTIDNTFDPGTGPNAEILDITVQSNDKILIAGEFTEYNGINKKYIARLESNGGLSDLSDWTPEETSTVAWYDASDTTTIAESGGIVSHWDDKSPSEYNLSNKSGNPSIGVETINGLQAVTLTNDILGGAGNENPYGAIGGIIEDAFVIMVTKNIVSPSVNELFNLAGNSFPGPYYKWIAQWPRFAGFFLTIGGSSLSKTFNAINGQNYILGFYGSTIDSTSAIYEDGVTVASTSGAVSEIIGNKGIEISGTHALGEIIFVNNTVDEPTRQLFEGYLAHKWGLEGNLSGGHPYQNDAPIIIGGIQNTNNTVTSVKIDSNGKVLISGDFTDYNGTTVNRIVRLNSDGTIDNTFDSGTGFNDTVNILQIKDHNKILAAGDFTEYDGTTANRIVRLNSDGTIDNSFDYGTGFNNTVKNASLCENDRVFVMGDFTEYNGIIAK